MYRSLSINGERIFGPCNERKIQISTEITISLMLGDEAKPGFRIDFDGKLALDGSHFTTY